MGIPKAGKGWGPGDIKRDTWVSCDPQGHYTGQDTSAMSSPSCLCLFPCWKKEEAAVGFVCICITCCCFSCTSLPQPICCQGFFQQIFAKEEKKTEIFTRIPVHDFLEKLQEDSGGWLWGTERFPFYSALLPTTLMVPSETHPVRMPEPQKYTNAAAVSNPQIQINGF